MATILPFKGIRPAQDKVHLVVTRSVDNYRLDVLKHKLETNPFSFLHVINPDFNDGKKTKPGSKERLQKVKKSFQQFLKDEIFIQDQKDSYYLYQQFKDGNVYTGIMGCSAVEDYDTGVIKKHEQTIKDREEKLASYLDVCNFNAEPVLFSYQNNAIIDEIVSQVLLKHPMYDFSTTDKVRHKLWVISNSSTVRSIESEFRKINAVYIADGHHRSASSSSLAHSRKSKNPNHKGNEPYNFYLGVFFPEDQLKIVEFNRLVTDLNGLSKEEFLQKLKQNFKVVPHHSNPYKPEHKHKFGMYLDGSWYELISKSELGKQKDSVKKLDASILSDFILSPILGIDDLRTNKRISFMPGVKGLNELKNQVDQGKFTLAFVLYPVSMSELKHIADIDGIMPPKTTWIEPKMRSGLLVYSLDNAL